MQQVSWFVAKLRSPLDPIRRWVVRQIAARKASRALLNRYYGRLSDKARFRFSQRYMQVFRGRGLFGGEGVPLAPGEWKIRFSDRDIRLPLRPSWAWLDWEHACSVIGHDPEVIQTYAAIIDSDQRPVLFLDVGANYGTHSVLFLSAGIPVIAFEPNPTCVADFQVICELNGLKGRFEQVAIGDRSGHIDLVYPEKDPWLGSISSDVVPNLEAYANVITKRVPLRMLDEYLAEIPRDKVLIKIDVEGSEPEVIQGATRLLQHCQPRLIFESNDARRRSELFQLLADRGYSILPLPWRPSSSSRVLDIGAFLASKATNFIAIA
jgi:FkbM family methyltransferase